MFLTYSLVFRYVFVYLGVPMIHVFYSSKTEDCRSCAILLTVVICSTVMVVLTIINVLKVLYDNYNLHKNIDSLSEQQLRGINSIKHQESVAIVLWVVISLLSLLLIEFNQCFVFIPFILSGASPMPCCSVIDFLFYEEMRKKNYRSSLFSETI